MSVLTRGGEEDRAAAARKVLEIWTAAAPADAAEADRAGRFPGIIQWRLQVLRARGGRALCAFTVPRMETGTGGRAPSPPSSTTWERRPSSPPPGSWMSPSTSPSPISRRPRPSSLISVFALSKWWKLLYISASRNICFTSKCHGCVMIDQYCANNECMQFLSGGREDISGASSSLVSTDSLLPGASKPPV